MSLEKYFESLKPDKINPRADFITKVCQECGVHQVTVYRWINGKVKPSKSNREVIAKITKKSVKSLFPKTNANEVD